MGKHRKLTAAALLVIAGLLVIIWTGQKVASATGLAGFLFLLAAGQYRRYRKFLPAGMLFLGAAVFSLNGFSVIFYIPAILATGLPYYKMSLNTAKIKNKMHSRVTELDTRRKKLGKKFGNLHSELEKMREEGKRLVKLYEVSKEIENILTPDEVSAKALDLISDYPLEKASFYRSDGTPVHNLFGAGRKKNTAKKEQTKYGVYEFTLKSGTKELGVIKIEGGLNERIKEELKVIIGQISLGYEKSLLYERVRKLSRIDALTKLHRRNYFMERFKQEIRRAEREKYEIAFIMIDIDKFKEYNDSYGHLMGDGVLADVSSIILKNIYDSDFAGRYGGEEFTVYMPRASSEKAMEKMEKIRNLVREKTPVTISAGISSFPLNGEKPEKIMKAADEALFKSKKEGRDRTTVYL